MNIMLWMFYLFVVLFVVVIVGFVYVEMICVVIGM